MTLALLLASLALAACHNPASTPGAAAYGGAPAVAGPGPIVIGTAIDASTGKPLEGVLVRAPGGVEAKSDARGRFLLRDLALGAEGELVGTTKGGLEGRNVLRPLAPGPLEVVLYLRPARR